MLSVNIRKTSIKDIPRIVELWKALTKHHVRELGFGKGLYKLKKGIGPGYGKFVKKQIRSRNAAVFVAEKENKLIGFALVYIQKLPPILVHDKEAYVSDIFVEDLYRRKGLGSMLLREAEKWADEKGIFSLGLVVDTKNDAALAAYRKFGFFEHRFKMSKIIK